MPTICAKCTHVLTGCSVSGDIVYYCAFGIDTTTVVHQITGRITCAPMLTCAQRRGSPNPTADCPDYEAAKAEEDKHDVPPSS